MAKSPKKSKPWTAAQIKAVRVGKDLLQKDAAALLRVSQGLWADWERGHRVPSPAHRLLLDLLEADQLPAPEAD